MEASIMCVYNTHRHIYVQYMLKELNKNKAAEQEPR